MNGWDERITLENYEKVLLAVEPTILFFCKDNQSRFKDYDYWDIYQVLAIKLWEMLRDGKIPKDMETCDYRFRRYLQTAFSRHLITIYRSKVSRIGPKQSVHVPRDLIEVSIPMSTLTIEL